MRPALRFLRRPAGERRLLLEAAALVAAVRLSLWLMPFARVRRLAARASSGQAGPGRASAGQLAWAVLSSSRFVPGASCLTQALAGQVLFARHARPTQLHIGVARSPTGAFQAHAWLESEARVVIGGGELERYTPLVALEARQP